jgi:CheY-like chemotaxis protein
VQLQGQDTRQTVLLIVADNSLRRLITLGLQYRDMRTIEASSPAVLPADELEERQPDLLVLDVDSGVSSDWSLLETVQEHHYLSTLPIVVLAWECLPPKDFDGELGEITCLVKPFDARTLHAKIEQLLAASRSKKEKPVVTAVAASANTTQAQEPFPVLAAHEQNAHPTASIWPFITAFGLLLTVVGLMVQISLSGVGLLIVLAGLLWWTLGTKPEPPSLPVNNQLAPVGGGMPTSGRS